jgi:hypothetical protein
LQDRIGNRWDSLTERQEQCLGARHGERLAKVREQATFKHTSFFGPDHVPERIGYGAFKAGVILDWNEVGVIGPEPGQHARMNFAVKVVHEERAEDRDVVLMSQLIEQVFEVHAGGDVPSLPQDVDHLSPPAHFGVTPASARFSDDVSGEPEEQR